MIRSASSYSPLALALRADALGAVPARGFGGIRPVLVHVARAVATSADERAGADHPADDWRAERRNSDQDHNGKDDGRHWYNHPALQFT